MSDITQAKGNTGPEKPFTLLTFPEPKPSAQDEAKVTNNIQANQLLMQFVDVLQIKDKRYRAKQFCNLRTDIFNYVFLEMDKGVHI